MKQGSTTPLTQDYSGEIEYKNGALEAIYHAEGRVKNLGASLRYEYTLRDHLGNGRVYFADLNHDNNGTVADILQDVHYYPFGMTIEDPRRVMPGAGNGNNYQYNGKEWNDDWGLNWTDYGARFYDASVGRWWSVDPMSEKYSNWSMYSYAVNNPTMFVDPDGKDNIIYLVALKGSRKHVNINKLIESANAYYNNLGLKTRVVLYVGKVENLKNIDKTDAIAVLGSTKDQISDFVQKNLSEVTSDEYRDLELKNWENSKDNPERSENNAGNGGNLIVINAMDLKETANNFLSTKAEAGAFLLVHGSGHNAGIYDDDGYTNLMATGDAITAMIQGSNGNPMYNNKNECYTHIQDFTNTRNNDIYLVHFMKRFGNNNPNPKLNKK